MHLYSNSLSAIATISSLIVLEFLPAYFSCCNNFSLSQTSLRLEDKNLVEPPFRFDFLREPARIAGDLNNSM